MKHFLFIFAASVCYAFTLSISKAEITPDKIIPYKTTDKGDLGLHVFNPPNHKETDQRPAIVLFFGGGWMGGTPSQFYQHAQAFAKLGMVAISADYRVKGKSTGKARAKNPFDCVADGKSAIRWVRAHAKELGIDPNRIVAGGGSAGGHVAACTGVFSKYDESGEDLQISSTPNAMVLYNPVLDTTEQGYGAGAFPKDKQTDLSPCHHVVKGIPPTIVFHGTKDKTVPFENAERFTKLMQEAGNQCVLIPYKGKDHGFFNGSHFRPQNGDVDFNKIIEESASFLLSIGMMDPAR